LSPSPGENEALLERRSASCFDVVNCDFRVSFQVLEILAVRSVQPVTVFRDRTNV